MPKKGNLNLKNILSMVNPEKMGKVKRGKLLLTYRL